MQTKPAPERRPLPVSRRLVEAHPTAILHILLEAAERGDPCPLVIQGEEPAPRPASN